MAGPRSKLDSTQVLPHSFDDEANALRFVDASALIPVSYDSVEITYTGANPTTVLYKKAGELVATLTLTYDGSDNLTTIVRS